jgi:predicted outer membrane protein
MNTVRPAPSRARPCRRSFANKAAVGGQAEVELGKLAQERASNDAVRQFDHGKANEKLMQLANNKNLRCRPSLDSKHRRSTPTWRALVVVYNGSRTPPFANTQ